jgi:hypothetical protein
MLTLALLQAGAYPAWVGPTAAISLAIIALCVVAIAIALVTLAARVGAQVKRLGSMADGFQDDVTRTLATLRKITEQGQDLMVLVRHEAGAFAQTSRRVRRKVISGADRIETRLHDLEALYDVVHAEVEDTALDVAATLRSARRGGGMLGRVRRLIVPSR